MSISNNMVSSRNVLVKLILDSQININRLIAMQEQQMIYINDLMSKVDNESTTTVATGTGTGTGTAGKPTTTTETNSQEIKVKDSQSDNNADKPTNTQSVTKKH